MATDGTKELTAGDKRPRVSRMPMTYVGGARFASERWSRSLLTLVPKSGSCSGSSCCGLWYSSPWRFEVPDNRGLFDVRISSWPYGPLTRSLMNRSDIASIVAHSGYIMYLNRRGQQIGRSRRYWRKDDFQELAELLAVPLFVKWRLFGLLNGGEVQTWT